MQSEVFCVSACVIGLTLGISIAALVVALNSQPVSEVASLRIPITTQENVNGTARLFAYSASSNAATVTLLSVTPYLHFQRSGETATISLELENGSRLGYDNIAFTLDYDAYVVLNFVNVPHLTEFMSACRGSFGNRLFFSVDNTFSNNNAGLVQSLGGPDHFIVFYHVAPGATYPIPWRAGNNYIPLFSLGYGIPDTACEAAAMSGTIDERLEVALNHNGFPVTVK